MEGKGSWSVETTPPREPDLTVRGETGLLLVDTEKVLNRTLEKSLLKGLDRTLSQR